MASSVSNIYLINAPAGSGKTTRIKSMINESLISNPNDNILCITYTNRAVNELKIGLESNNVFISTIHSFLNKFIGIYFSNKQIVELYFEIYNARINERIINFDRDENVEKSNNKYIEKYGSLSLETLKENITSIFYNESQYSSLYYGGLSHDDLIFFAKSVFDKFTVIKKRLTQKYQAIFIDEYQDSSIHVLKMFYDAVIDTRTSLFLLGDKMQQIYKNYDGSFEEEFSKLNKSISLNINYRSIPRIIDILNNLYNEVEYKQLPDHNIVLIEPDFLPRVIFCENVKEMVQIEKEIYPFALELYLLNQQRFTAIDAGNLYSTLNRIEKYSFGSKYTAVNIISDSSNDNPDILIKLLFIVHQICEQYKISNFGGINQIIKNNTNIFDNAIIAVNNHNDKMRVRNILENIISVYNDDTYQLSINEMIKILRDSGMVYTSLLDLITESGEYSEVLNVNICEFRAVARYLINPNVSTQHGVKGESHDTVFFIAEDSSNTQPLVHMYNFLKLWSTVDISLNIFEAFYYDYLRWINETNTQLGFKLSNLNSQLYALNSHIINHRINELINNFKNNQIFECLCKDSYNKYLLKPNVKNAKQCFKESEVYGSLSAYRLFYVGCSRARRNLTIFIDANKVSGFREKLVNKFISVGFNVLQ